MKLGIELDDKLRGKTKNREWGIMTHFPKLFEPGRIGKLDLKNRIIMPPMVTRYINEYGEISERILNYYAERATGGCAMVIVEASYPRFGSYPGRIFIGNDKCISDLRKLVEVIHEGGAKACIEINIHRGRRDEVDPASASETVHPETGTKVRALSIVDLKELEYAFGEAVKRVKEAGFDCIMIHGGSGFLVSEFLSPRLNKRTDDYGGHVKKRARLALELVITAKEKAGTDYPIIFRLTADERIEGGFGLNDGIMVSRLLEEAGIDLIDVTSGAAETHQMGAPCMHIPRGLNASISESVKKEVKIPVSFAGGINDPYMAEEILRWGKADFIGLGRALIADSHFPNKAIAGNVDDIRKCIRCNRCIESILKPPVGPLICSVNPAAGREREFKLGLKPAYVRKKVLVIGGGPAGIEAAIIAAQRKHNVTIWEKDEKLGGQLNLAVVPPDKDELKSLIEYLKLQLYKLKITVKLNKKGTTKAILEFSPDVVIEAVGSKPLIPNIKGIEKRKLITVRDVLSGKTDVGKKVTVIGGGFVGCETAEFLIEKQKEVTIIEILSELASELLYSYANLMIQRLKERKVKSYTGVKDEEITDKGMKIIDKEGKRIFLKADSIVVATGSLPNESLFESFKEKDLQFYKVGDCRKPARIYESISEGAEAGLRV